jgi:tetratricopeptide (TPR) repeat protein
MIGPVSETGRTMMTSLQQAIQKGMPPEQAVAYVKSMAVDGVAPLTDLYSMMKQFQRLKEPQRQMPEGGTLRDQLNMLENVQEPMGQGLGGMDAGAMEAPSFAGGGIVAFQQGGVSAAPPMDPSDPNYVKSLMEYYGQYGKPQGEFVDERMEASEDAAKKYGLGQYGEAFKARQAQATEMQRALPGQEAEERKLDRAEFFFNLAAAAADPGATFATSLGKAGSGYTKAQRATNERLRGLQKEAQEAGLKMLEAEQLRKEGDYKSANQLYTQGREQALETGLKIWEETGRREDQAAMRRTMIAQVNADPGGIKGITGRIAKQIEDDPNISPEDKYAMITGRGGNTKLLTLALNSIDKRITTLQNNLTKTFPPAEKAAIQADLQEAISERQQLIANNPELAGIMSGAMGAGGGAGATGGTSGGNILKFNPKTGRIE